MQPSDALFANRRAVLGYSVVIGITLVMPLVLWRLPMPFVRVMDAIYHPLPLLQLFVFWASLALTAIGAYAFWQDRGQTVQKQFPLLLALLVFFHFLALLRQYDARAWDYACYERAAQAIVQGANPYGDCYIYFPTPAQALAWLYQAGAFGATTLLGNAAKAETLWDLVFYWYEALQFVQVMLAYALCYRLARRLGLGEGRASVVVALLFLFNNPLLATLKHNQVNLWVLNLLLLAMLWLPRAPFLSGLCVAIGGHIKLYPLILLLPWTLMRQWRALLAVAIGMSGLVLVQTRGGGQDWRLWQAFLAFADAFPKGTFFRDNSLHSLVYNTIGQLKWLLGDSSYTVNEQTVGRIVLILAGIFGLLYVGRFLQREHRYLLIKEQQAAPSPEQAYLLQLGHMMEAIALGLLLSPVVWEHHYLLALPLVIWALASQQTVDQLWVVALSAFLMFVIPTFDVFPLSYHRLVGLLLLVATFPPVLVAPWPVVQTLPLAFLKNSQQRAYSQISES